MNERDPYRFDKIPDFAMQPARDDIDDFDPSVYEKLLAGLTPAESGKEQEEKPEAAISVSAPASPAVSAETESLEPTVPEVIAVPAPKTEDTAASIPEQEEAEPLELKERASAKEQKSESEASEVEEEGAAEKPIGLAEQEAPEPSAPALPALPEESGEATAILEAPEVKPKAPMATPEAQAEVLEPQNAMPEPQVQTQLGDEEKTEEPGERSVIAAGDDVMTDSLRLVDMIPGEPVRIFVEEDILVPDVKPDLSSVLSMDATLRFSEKGKRVNGELLLQTLYIPEGKGADRSIVSIESRLPFRQEGESAANAEDVKASAVIESLDYSVINERKFRIKAVIAVEGREYRNRKLHLFEGLKDDEVQMLQEKLVVTDVILRKTEHLELEEDMTLPETLPDIGKVLRCDVNLVENHKQVSREKAVISGTAYCNLMYLPAENTVRMDSGETAGGAAGARGTMPGAESGTPAIAFDNEPVLFQGKSEFTQFIPLAGPGQTEHPSGGRVFFQLNSASVEPRESESGQKNVCRLKVEADTFVELYRDIEREIVTDAYHHQKEMVFDTEEISLMQLCPGGVAETTVREVVNVPDPHEGVERVAFVSGNLSGVRSHIEGGKNVAEGSAVVKIVCLADDAAKTPFSIRREIPFRVTMELPGGMEEAVTDNEVLLKEIRFDRLNNRQIELNASVMVNGAVIRRKKCPLIRNVGFLESSGPEKEMPGFVLYTIREGDTLWKIARKYRTTIDSIAKINSIDSNGALQPGMKLLVVK